MEIEPSYCPFCGDSLEEKMSEERERKYCASCDRIIYQNPKPVAAVAVVDNGKILMVKRGIDPGRGQWSLPAGFIEKDEPPHEAAARELEEETGVRVDPEALEVLGIAFEERLPDQYVVASVYTVDVSETEGDPRGGDDAEEANFWDIEQLRRSDEEFRDAFRGQIEKLL